MKLVTVISSGVLVALVFLTEVRTITQLPTTRTTTRPLTTQSPTEVRGYVKTFGGNGGGASCVFPFVYKGRHYYTCTTVHHNRLWCATTSNNDKDKKWGNCADNGYVYTVGGNGGGASCVFPFTYKGRHYYTCTKASWPRPWCATTSNYDIDKKWGDCAEFNGYVNTLGGNGGGAPCVFPFVYKGRHYYTCAKDSWSRRMFCATTSNMDIDKKWGFCAGGYVKPFGGNGGGASCVFPFVYKGRHYDTCIQVNHKQPWCATTFNYDKDKKWGNCPGDWVKTFGGNGRGGSCVFPFVYKGRHYFTCTKVSHNRLWCATTWNFPKYGDWGYCVSDTNKIIP